MTQKKDPIPPLLDSGGGPPDPGGRPDVSTVPVQRHRRRRHRRRPLWWFGAVVALCAAVLAGLPYLRPTPRAPQEVLDTPIPYPAGLVVDKLRFDPPQGARRIAGVVRNKSSADIARVKVRFGLWDAAGDPMGEISVTVGDVLVLNEVPFQSEPVAAEVARWGVVGLEGVPPTR